jgi:predicted nucleotidyltransferase
MIKKLLQEDFDSSNLFEKMSILSEAEYVDICKGITWTAKNYPDAVIIGGTALIHYLHNSRNLTPDVDFMVDDISKLKLTLQDCNLHFSLIKGDKGNIGITVEEFNTDYLSPNSGNPEINKLILSNYNTANICGNAVKIVIPELLVIMKIELARDKDVDDALALMTTGVLNKEVYLKFVNALKGKISDFDSLIDYTQLIKDIKNE